MIDFAAKVNGTAKRLNDRAAIAREIIAVIHAVNNPIPASRFNDDDWYVYDKLTNEVLRQYSHRAFTRYTLPQLPEHQVIARGMVIKHLGLWKVGAA
jgi:transcriptional regulator of NAD metabolism